MRAMVWLSPVPPQTARLVSLNTLGTGKRTPTVMSDAWLSEAITTPSLQPNAMMMVTVHPLNRLLTANSGYAS